MISDKLLDQIKSEVTDRATWEERQATWFKLRYEGIGRAAKPYKNAPDMHYPLVDSFIEKMKPFYLQQLYGQERLAAFVSGKPQLSEETTLAEKLFDYSLRQRTNFERTIFTSIDHMLMYGHGPVKIFWANNKLVFRSVRPVYLIVPSWTEELGDAEWLVHIIHMSVDEYRRKKGYEQDAAFVKSITGSGEPSGATTTQQQSIQKRKGINIGMDDDQIVLWEIYYRDDAGNIKIGLLSPVLGTETPVREEFGLPYKHGKFPFADLRYELADTDYYASRGVSEILHQFELDLCKMWNHKLQFLDFFGQPSYKNSGLTSVSPGNFQNAPGKILPAGIEPNPTTDAPLDFEKEMQLQRALAEDRVQIPDLSAGEHLTGERGTKGGVTATQINALMNQSGVGNDMRARIFRLQLGNIYQQAWAIMADKLPEDQRMLEDYTQVGANLLHLDYRVAPSGSADGLSKEQRIQKALAYNQLLKGDPSIKQNELTKWTLEQDDASLVSKLYQEPEEAQQDEAERQANEIVLMTYDFPAQVKPGDSDPIHLTTIDKFLEHASGTGKQVSPQLAGLLLNHSTEHVAAIQQKKDKQGQQAVQQLQGMFKYLGEIAAQLGQQASGSPVAGGPGASGAPPSGKAQLPASQRESISISYKDAPPSVQRQMEQSAGFVPANPQEAAMHDAVNSKIVQDAVKPRPQPAQSEPKKKAA